MKDITQDKMYIFSPKSAQVFWLVFSLKILMQVNTHNT